MKKYIIIFFISVAGIYSLLYGPETRISDDDSLINSTLDELFSQSSLSATINQDEIKRNITEEVKVIIGTQPKLTQEELKNIITEKFNNFMIKIAEESSKEQSIEQQEKILNAEKRMNENSEDLKNFNKRFIYYNANYHVYYLRALLQPFRWLCGFATIFNALHISEYLNNINENSKSNWKNKIPNQTVYNLEKFKEFESNTAGFFYKNKTLKKDEDFVVPEVGVSSDFYLEDSNMIDYCRENNILHCSSLIYTDAKTVIINESTDFSQTRDVDELRDQLKKNFEDRKVVHFFCNTGFSYKNNKNELGNHWILLSVCKNQNNPTIIIVDSFNNSLDQNYQLIPYIREIISMFYPQGTYEKLIRADILFRAVVAKFDRTYPLSYLQRFRNSLEKIRQHGPGFAFAAGLLGALYFVYRKITGQPPQSVSPAK